jgi:hypothetical protein
MRTQSFPTQVFPTPKFDKADNVDSDQALVELSGFDAAPVEPDLPGVDDSGPLAPAERDQLARDIAAIERASEVLRRAEPTLDAWSQSPPGTTSPTLGQPRPVWLLIGVLWISAAIVTLGAAVTIAALVG